MSSPVSPVNKDACQANDEVFLDRDEKYEPDIELISEQGSTGVRRSSVSSEQRNQASLAGAFNSLVENDEIDNQNVPASNESESGKHYHSQYQVQREDQHRRHSPGAINETARPQSQVFIRPSSSTEQPPRVPLFNRSAPSNPTLPTSTSRSASLQFPNQSAPLLSTQRSASKSDSRPSRRVISASRPLSLQLSDRHSDIPTQVANRMHEKYGLTPQAINTALEDGAEVHAGKSKVRRTWWKRHRVLMIIIAFLVTTSLTGWCLSFTTVHVRNGGVSDGHVLMLRDHLHHLDDLVEHFQAWPDLPLDSGPPSLNCTHLLSLYNISRPADMRAGLVDETFIRYRLLQTAPGKHDWPNLDDVFLGMRRWYALERVATLDWCGTTRGEMKLPNTMGPDDKYSSATL